MCLAVTVDEQVRAGDLEGAFAHLHVLGQSDDVAVEADEFLGLLAGEVDVERGDLHSRLLAGWSEACEEQLETKKLSVQLLLWRSLAGQGAR